MSYIGNPVLYQAFVTDQFSGNGSTTTFTMSVSPANTASVLVSVSGVLQDPTTYAISGTTLTFSGAPPAGTGNISVRYLGIPASGVTTTAYRTVTEFTATSAQTTFSVPSYTVGFINVYRNGVRLGASDFTATSGTTVVLANACASGDLVVTESFYVSSVLNAIPATAGAVNTTYLVDQAVTTAKIADASITAAKMGAGVLATPSVKRWDATLRSSIQSTSGSYTDNLSSYVSSKTYGVVLLLGYQHNGGANHGYWQANFYQSGKGGVSNNVFSFNRAHFDWYYNDFVVEHVLPWDPTGSTNLIVDVQGGYFTGANTYRYGVAGVLEK